MGVRIEGLDDVMRMYKEAPEELLKDAKDASRTAAKEAAKDLRAKMPKEYRTLVTSTVRILSDGTLSTHIGMFQKKKIPGLWDKAYWSNYGTIERRDPSHEFRRPVQKSVPKRRNNRGQPHLNFYDGPASGTADKFLAAFKEHLRKKGYDIQ